MSNYSIDSNLSDSDEGHEADGPRLSVISSDEVVADAALEMLVTSHDTHKAQLAALASTVDMINDQRGETWARLEVDGHRETQPIRGRAFRSWLVSTHHEIVGDVVSRSSVRDALQLIEAQAGQSGEPHRLDNRFSWRDGELWYDLVDRRWRAVRIDEGGWEIVELPPPYFRRYSHQRAQVDPVNGGDLRELLLPLVNVSEGESSSLYLVWLVCGFLPHIPRPALVPFGSQGSGKTQLTRLSRAILDPSQVPAPRTPRGDKEWAQLADHHAVVALDNLSTVNERTSDALCRAVTGDGLSKRRLYTDEEDVIFTFRRQVILNGISAPAQKADLLDRSILLCLPSIKKSDRRPEQAIWRDFEAARGKIMGAIFSSLAEAIRHVDDVELDDLPRMADFTVWGFAVAEALGIGGHQFLRAYRRNRQSASRRAVESHPLGEAVLAFMANRGRWEGSPSKLLEQLNAVAKSQSIDRRHELWPKSPDWITRRLAEIEPNLKGEGISFRRSRDSDGRRLLTLETDESA